MYICVCVCNIYIYPHTIYNPIYIYIVHNPDIYNHDI